MILCERTNSELHSIPHKEQYDKWRAAITEEEFKLIEEQINDKLDTKGKITSSWLAPKEWKGTIYEPISRACEGNKKEAGYFLGLIIFDVVLNRNDCKIEKSRKTEGKFYSIR